MVYFEISLTPSLIFHAAVMRCVLIWSEKLTTNNPVLFSTSLQHSFIHKRSLWCHLCDTGEDLQYIPENVF